MELVLILVGVAVVFIAALLVFFVSLRMMQESSYDEIAAEKTRRQEEIERELGIVRTTKDIKKELNKKKKEKKVKSARELEKTEESDEQDSGLDIIETSAQRKGKKSQKIASNAENTQLVENPVEKADSKKKGKASQSNTGGGVKNAKARASGKSNLDDFGTSEPEVPFIMAEGKNKKKKQTVLQAEGLGVSSVSSAKETAVSKAVSATPRDQAKPKISDDVSTGKQNTPKLSNSGTT